MEYSSYIFLFLFNLSLYFVTFLMVFKRENYSAISIRSPKLIIISWISSFITSSSLISYDLVDEYDNTKDFAQLFCVVSPFIFLIGHLSFFITLIFRIHRVLQCCNINNLISTQTSGGAANKSKAKNFYAKRYMLDEPFYWKAFSIVLTGLFALLIILWVLKASVVAIPFHFAFCHCDKDAGVWVSYMINNYIYLIEGIIWLTYAYKAYYTNLKKIVKAEIISQIVLYLIFYNLWKYADGPNDEAFHTTSYIFILFNYIFLSLNSLFALGITLIDKVKTTYHFNPKLASNWYLFLSDEICYYSFSDFMKGRDIDNFFICLYTQIMKYKYKYTWESDYYKVLDDAKAIYENYFDEKSGNTYWGEDLIVKVRVNCNWMLSKNDFTYEMFDECWVYVYDYLEGRFNEYRKSEEYFVLVNNLNLISYVQYKMSSSHSTQGNSLIY